MQQEPDDVVTHIFSFLPLLDFLSLSRTCRRFYVLAQSICVKEVPVNYHLKGSMDPPKISLGHEPTEEYDGRSLMEEDYDPHPNGQNMHALYDIMPYKPRTFGVRCPFLARAVKLHILSNRESDGNRWFDVFGYAVDSVASLQLKTIQSDCKDVGWLDLWGLIVAAWNTLEQVYIINDHGYSLDAYKSALPYVFKRVVWQA